MSDNISLSEFRKSREEELAASGVTQETFLNDVLECISDGLAERESNLICEMSEGFFEVMGTKVAMNLESTWALHLFHEMSSSDCADVLLTEVDSYKRRENGIGSTWFIEKKTVLTDVANRASEKLKERDLRLVPDVGRYDSCFIVLGTSIVIEAEPIWDMKRFVSVEEWSDVLVEEVLRRLKEQPVND